LRLPRNCLASARKDPSTVVLALSLAMSQLCRDCAPINLNPRAAGAVSEFVRSLHRLTVFVLCTESVCGVALRQWCRISRQCNDWADLRSLSPRGRDAYRRYAERGPATAETGQLQGVHPPLRSSLRSSPPLPPRGEAFRTGHPNATDVSQTGHDGPPRREDDQIGCLDLVD